MKALLAIAGKVQKGGKHVTAEDVERARSHGATDKEIHDTVLIAAAFCMFNRYVDGLDTWQPHDAEFYREVESKRRRWGMLPATGSSRYKQYPAIGRRRPALIHGH